MLFLIGALGEHARPLLMPFKESDLSTGTLTAIRAAWNHTFAHTFVY